MVERRREKPRRALAALAALVVGAVHERVLRVGVAHEEADVGREFDRLELAGVEIGDHEMVAFAEDGGRLVEQAALHAGELVFGLLPDERDVEGGDRHAADPGHRERGPEPSGTLPRNIASKPRSGAPNLALRPARHPFT